MFIIAVVTSGGGHMANIGKKMFICLLAQYGVAPDDIVSVSRKTSDRQVWRVNDPAGVCLEICKGSQYSSAIAAVNEYLHQKGVPVIKVLPTKQGSPVVRTDRGSFMLFPW